MRDLLFLYILLTLIWGCERKEPMPSCDGDGETRTQVNLDVDWSDSHSKPKNVTVLFYDHESGDLEREFCYEEASHERQANLRLADGCYDVVVFNELRDQIDYVRVRGHERLSTLEFYASEDTQAITRATDMHYINQSGDLLVDLYESFVVGAEGELSLSLKPRNRLTTIDLTIYVENLEDARMPALAHLVAVADGYCVAKDRNTTTPAIIQFLMDDHRYTDGGNGTISGSVVCFGTLGDRGSVVDQLREPMMLDLSFMMRDDDKTQVNRQIDITNMLIFSDDPTQGMQSVSFYVEQLGDPLPDLKPEGGDLGGSEGSGGSGSVSGGSGFGSGVSDWGDERVDLMI